MYTENTACVTEKSVSIKQAVLQEISFATKQNYARNINLNASGCTPCAVLTSMKSESGAGTKKYWTINSWNNTMLSSAFYFWDKYFNLKKWQKQSTKTYPLFPRLYPIILFSAQQLISSACGVNKRMKSDVIKWWWNENERNKKIMHLFLFPLK